MKPTQCDRILWILNDGAWHSHHDFYGFCVLHSRISELRKRGHNIEYRREGDRHLYRLVSLSQPADCGAAPAGSGSEGGVGDMAETGAGPHNLPDPVRRSAQLSFVCDDPETGWIKTMEAA